jgi:hypothetical protein
MERRVLLLTLGCSSAVVAAAGTGPAPLAATVAVSGAVTKTALTLPLAFEASAGPADSGPTYVARAAGYTLLLAPREAVLLLRSSPGTLDRSVVRMRFRGGAARPRVEGLDELPGKVNYLIGRDKRRWRTGLPLYGKVRYREIYPGIDAVFYGRDRQIEYDLVVSPGADPGRIRIVFGGARLGGPDRSGALVLRTEAGDLLLHQPVVYQGEGASRRSVAAAYRVGRGVVRIAVGRYDREQPLVIDPVLTYSTFLGGSNESPSTSEAGYAIAVVAGNVYVAGSTSATDFPVKPTGAVVDDAKLECRLFPRCAFDRDANGGTDAFVTKFSATGALVYSTYFGGLSDDVAKGIAVDGSGSAYIAGDTRSLDFPITAGAYQGEPPDEGEHCEDCEERANRDVFVAKLNATGTDLVFSTFVRGRGDDSARAIAVDSGGRAHVTGETLSHDFADSTRECDQPCADWDGFVAALQADGAGLVYSRYLGGTRFDGSRAIALDDDGNAYVAGTTRSRDFPTRGGCEIRSGVPPVHFCFDPLQDELKGGSDAFVSKLGTEGQLVWSTYLGGELEIEDLEIEDMVGEAGNAVAVRSVPEPDGTTRTDVYVAGDTTAADFPVVNAFQNVHAGGGNDAFVARLTSTASSLVYSTFLGGSDQRGLQPDETASALAVGADGSAYVAGWTTSTRCETVFPVVRPIGGGGCQPGHAGPDAFVARLGPDGSLHYATLLGGPDPDRAHGAALDAAGALYVTGETKSVFPPNDFPTTPNGYRPTPSGSSDAFVAKLVEGAPGSAQLSVIPPDPSQPVLEGADFTYDIGVLNGGSEAASNVALLHTLSTEVEFKSVTSDAGQCSLTMAKKLICNLGSLPPGQVGVHVTVHPNKKLP